MPAKKEENEGLIRPMKGRAEPSLGPDVILALIPTDLAYLVRLNQGKDLHCADMNHFKVYWLTDGTGAPLSFAGPFLGAPQAVMGMEKVIALGAQRIWVWGWCGSLQPDLRIGDLVIPIDAVSEEGTSKHYPVGDKPVLTDEGLNRMLGETLRQEGQAFRSGTTWTTDAVYRETAEKVRSYQEMGVLAVEMEMSALMTLAVFRSVRVTGLLVVSDELSSLRWRPGFRDPGFEGKCRMAGRLLWELVASLRGRENGYEQ